MLELARAGAVEVHVKTYGIAWALLVYEWLYEGNLIGPYGVIPRKAGTFISTRRGRGQRGAVLLLASTGSTATRSARPGAG
ncbi:hypothetical protein GCM10018781_77700 [Kitasatospora indigofera]|uniref:Uncharacterized protein n=1 Tax=Kitasatospora indigofera TaxID=67307 RepID=A0A918YUQ6_9ACTN|nr:hypothetical protein GCM10018781_77700 [Kitasatospora indigofera]